MIESREANSPAPHEEAESNPKGPTGFFYKGLGYGSEATTGPFDVLLNKGLAGSQFENRDRALIGYPFGTSHVWGSLRHPLAAIDRSGGWWTFLSEEVLPITMSTDLTDRKWTVNYLGHVLEGGITHRKLEEWFQARQVPQARVLAGATTYASALLNELYTHPGEGPGSAATLADLMIFDIAGIILFSQDGVARFFSEKLKATVWGSQAALTSRGEIANAGNYLIMKLPIAPIEGTSIFLRTGLALTLGLTFHRASQLDVSLGAGVEGHTHRVNPYTGEESPKVGFGAGIYLDREGSLLGSIHLSSLDHRLLVLNVYPGVIGPFGNSLGGWFMVRREDPPLLGISLRGAWGLGFAGPIGG